MTTTATGAARSSRAARWRLARLGAGAAALAVALTGVVVPSANALPITPGAWTLDTELGAGTFGSSYGVAVDPATGNFYVTDVDLNKLFKFNSKGQKLAESGGPGEGFGSFNEPRGVAVDQDGNVYVADSGNHIIQKLDKDLNWVANWGIPGQAGAGDNEFDYPADVTFDAQTGLVYVADTYNHRIKKHQSDGTWISSYGTLGSGDLQFDTPRGVATLSGGNVVVADTGNNRIQVISMKTPNPVLMKNFGQTGSNPGDYKMPADLAIDKLDRIFVADIGNDRIQKVDGQGTPDTEWSTPSAAQGIALDEAGTGRVYLADGANAVLSYRQATVPAFGVGSLAAGTAGKAYSANVLTSGFPGVSSLAITAGALPPGLKVAGGKVYGTPTKPGTYQVTLRADNGVEANPAVTKSFAITIVKAASRVSAKFSTKYPRVARTNIRATIKLSAPYTTGLSKTGKVRVYYGKKRVKTYTVKSSKGTVTVRLPKFTKKGKTRVTLRYLGNSQLKSAKRTIYVRVR